jgi:hypothetical protein
VVACASQGAPSASPSPPHHPAQPTHNPANPHNQLANGNTGIKLEDRERAGSSEPRCRHGAAHSQQPFGEVGHQPLHDIPLRNRHTNPCSSSDSLFQRCSVDSSLSGPHPKSPPCWQPKTVPHAVTLCERFRRCRWLRCLRLSVCAVLRALVALCALPFGSKMGFWCEAAARSHDVRTCWCRGANGVPRLQLLRRAHGAVRPKPCRGPWPCEQNLRENRQTQFLDPLGLLGGDYIQWTLLLLWCIRSAILVHACGPRRAADGAWSPRRVRPALLVLRRTRALGIALPRIRKEPQAIEWRHDHVA